MNIKKILPLILLMFSIVLSEVPADDSIEPSLSIGIFPGYGFPLGKDNTDFFSAGAGCDVVLKYKFRSVPMLYSGLRAGYDYLPVELNTAVSAIFVGPEAGILLAPASWLSVYLGVCGGYFYSMLNNGTGPGGGNPFIKPVVGTIFSFNSGFSLGLEGSYKNYMGLYQGAAVSLAGIIKIKGTDKSSGPVICEPVPLQQAAESDRLVLNDFNITDIFPVFYTYYDDHSIGSGIMTNNTDIPIENISLNLFIKKYMDNPKTCSTLKLLEPGGEEPVELFALFTDNILEITEGTKVSAELVLNYDFDGLEYQETYIETVRIYNRNATIWDDDRKVAAFVTSKEPVVLTMAKTAAGIARENGNGVISQNIRTAIALNEIMRLYGISYVTDPETQNPSFEDAMVLDFLQFPRQTLQYRAGDCDDLSILNCALFESVGIETAFITVPGHIYIAFEAGVSPDEAEAVFSSCDDFIVSNGTVWVPYEITELAGGFYSAWKKGGRQWREAEFEGEARLYPTHEAWRVFEPVGIPGQAGQITVPDDKIVKEAYGKEFQTVVESEIYPKVNKIEERIASEGESSRLLNSLGTLYARYGLTDKAEYNFLKILSFDSEYLPALINAGNIMLVKKRPADALSYYGKAEALNPSSPAVLLGLARTHHELENYGFVNKNYSKLREINPELAGKFDYLDMTRNEAARAADTEEMKTLMEWVEDSPSRDR